MAGYYQKFISEFPEYKDSDMVKRAFAVSEKAHEGQFRNSGEPYIIHPYEVVRILADLGLDEVSIAAGMLHDVPEDTDFTIDMVAEQFSPEIAKIVDGVTKLMNIKFKTQEEAQAESMRKMFLAMADDIRVIIIKLADRLHNMRTLDYKSAEKQRQKARETLDIYAPLAHRLGINKFKWEFEDLALKYLEPEAYHEIAGKLNSTRKEREEYIRSIIGDIRRVVDGLGVEAEIEGRPKHIYSIYKKMKTKAKTFEELYDLIAVRVIVNSVKDCYAILGAVHTEWRPLPMRFKDYIAVPKLNMYQSLHTTLLGSDGKPFEVQIRTYEMHHTAEFGIAAHWKYKSGIESAKQSDMDQKLAWLREMMELDNDVADSREFVEALKVNLFSDTVFVFTPKGDVKDFVKGSTPLDFAYSIHSHIGNTCVGAKVNGRIVPLNYELKTGDIIDILTSASSKGPSRDWLGMVKTATAKSKIRNYFRKEMREENIHKGRDMLEKEAKRAGYDFHELTRLEWLKPIFKKLTLSSVDDMYAAVGYGGVTSSQILQRLIEKYREENKLTEAVEYRTPKTKSGARDSSIIVKGNSDMLVRLAHCCNPLPGDDIIGFITRGRGVSVHRADCVNINDVDFPPERRIEVSWSAEDLLKYEVEIQLTGKDNRGVLAEVSNLLSMLGYNIIGLNVRTSKKGQFFMNVKLEVAAMKDLQALMDKLKMIPSIEDVFRVNN